MQRSWYKVTVVVLLLYSCIAGLWMPVPRLPILNETIRNVYFHVPVWFGLIVMCAYSAYGALRYLKNASAKWDQVSHTAAQTAMFLSVPGILTGSIWAKFTWGTWWTFQDPKLNGVALSILIYGAYFILRSAAHEPHKKAQLSAVYNIFAFVMLILFLLVLPRLTASLHPGNGGNPAFSKYDLDNDMRLIFYPAVLAWIGLSFWLFELQYRYQRLKELYNHENH